MIPRLLLLLALVFAGTESVRADDPFLLKAKTEITKYADAYARQIQQRAEVVVIRDASRKPDKEPTYGAQIGFSGGGAWTLIFNRTAVEALANGKISDFRNDALGKQGDAGIFLWTFQDCIGNKSECVDSARGCVSSSRAALIGAPLPQFADIQCTCRKELELSIAETPATGTKKYTLNRCREDLEAKIERPLGQRLVVNVVVPKAITGVNVLACEHRTVDLKAGSNRIELNCAPKESANCVRFSKAKRMIGSVECGPFGY